jgi:hypothetical protein
VDLALFDSDRFELIVVLDERIDTRRGQFGAFSASGSISIR